MSLVFETVPRPYWFYEDVDGVWRPFDANENEKLEISYFLFMNARKGSEVSLGYHLRRVDLRTFRETCHLTPQYRRVTRGTWFWKADDGSFVTYSPESTAILEGALLNKTFSHKRVQIDEKREVQQHTDGTYKQIRCGERGKIEGRVVVRGYNNQQCLHYTSPLYPAPPSFQIFGIDLPTLMCHPTNSGLPVPYIVYAIATCIFLNGTTTNGIFKSTGAIRVQQLRTLFDLGEFLDISGENVRVLGELLKEYLAALPEPLMTKNLYKAWTQAYDTDLIATQKTIKKLVQSLPTTNLYILKGLCSILYDVAANVALTTMSMELLAEEFVFPIFKGKIIDEYNLKLVLINMTIYHKLYFDDVVIPTPQPVYLLTPHPSNSVLTSPRPRSVIENLVSPRLLESTGNLSSRNTIPTNYGSPRSLESGNRRLSNRVEYSSAPSSGTPVPARPLTSAPMAVPKTKTNK